MSDDCPFCDYAGPNTILWETSAVYVVEPLRQVTPGHVLVIPRAHATDFATDAAVTAEAFRGAAEYVQANGVEDANLITSRGESASQTVQHIHVHVLPRTWEDSVRLPWGNPLSSPTPTHHLYLRAEREVGALQDTLAALRGAADERFAWEAFEAAKCVRQGKRYLEKIGEVLYCTWADCLHDDNRAIPLGEGEPYFKGMMHADCYAAMQEKSRLGT